MKYVFSGLFIILMSPYNLKSEELLEINADSINKNNQQQHQQQPQDDTTPQILQQFGGVVISFLNLLKAPDDREHTVTQIGNMVQGMFNIGQLVTKRNDKELVQRKFKEFFETEEGKHFLLYWNNLLNINSK
ncbi:hypothetical protein K9K77_01475 [Candidatus Babeliales bacterium]|nr:hypothetical protein [Candidatus Babeliales bacterium]